MSIAYNNIMRTCTCIGYMGVSLLSQLNQLHKHSFVCIFTVNVIPEHARACFDLSWQEWSRNVIRSVYRLLHLPVKHAGNNCWPTGRHSQQQTATEEPCEKNAYDNGSQSEGSRELLQICFIILFPFHNFISIRKNLADEGQIFLETM